MGIRFAAALLLLTQLHQLAVPVFCGLPDRSSAACGETMRPDAPRVAPHPSSDQAPCANALMCGIPATGIPYYAFSVLTAAPTRSLAAPAVSALQPGDPPAPLSPPPQA